MKKNYTVVLQGDSITDAGRCYQEMEPNRQMGNGYAALVTAQLTSMFPAVDMQVFNRGVSGHRVVDLYARWKKDTLNLKPDFLSILIGVNDTWHEFESGNGVEVPRYERIYREILTWTQTALPDTVIMLIEPFAAVSHVVGEDWMPEINERCAVVRKLAAEFNLPLVTNQWFVDAQKEAPALYWMPDGVHPGYAGHQRLTDAWIATAKPFLK